MANKTNDQGKQIVPGGKVKLISGGPVMALKAIRGELVTCQWFAGKKLETGHFNIVTLELAEDGANQ